MADQRNDMPSRREFEALVARVERLESLSGASLVERCRGLFRSGGTPEPEPAAASVEPGHVVVLPDRVPVPPGRLTRSHR